MEKSQGERLLFQLKIIIPDLDWGRKINFCSFSSVNLNMEHVTFSYTFHLLDTHPLSPYPHLMPQPQGKKSERRKERKRGNEDEKIFGKRALSVCLRGPFNLFQLG